MLKLVIFDMDGVLVDNMHVHIEAWEMFCRRYGVEEWQEKINSCVGMGNDDIMSYVLPADIVSQKTLKEWGNEKEAVYREIYADRIREVDGLTEFLKRLKNAGIACAVGSSGCRDNVEFVLGSCRIGEYFDVCISGDDVTRCKPDPEIYLTAARKAGVDPSECLVVEDAKAGILAARNAGMKVVALATTLPREVLAETDADMIADDFTRLSVAGLQAMFNR